MKMNLRNHKTLSNLHKNSRFYVLSSSILLSLSAAAWLRLQIPSDQLFYIRLEQIFGFLSVFYLYVAVSISPWTKVIGEARPSMKYLVFARRAIGVSAAYFAVLHAAVALWGQIGGLSGIGLLPGRFKWAFAFGLFALVVLLAMAATSFDKVIAFMTLRRWKWLHRFVYSAGVLVILHVWMIGTHVVYSWVKVIAFVALVVFFGLESLRVANKLAKRFKDLRQTEIIMIAVSIWAIWVLLLVALPNLVKNYHSERHGEQGTHQGASHD